MNSYFNQIPTIKYEGPDTKNPLAYRYYDANKIIAGKKMAEHFRFSVAYWHIFRANGTDPFGGPTIFRPWESSDGSIEDALRRVEVAFDFIEKLGLKYFCFHDRDIAPEGNNLTETNQNLDKVTEKIESLQKDREIRLLWGTANLFSHPRYMNGAATNPNAHVFAYAAAQVKKAMEITHRLGGSNFVFWGGREGYSSLINTNMRREQEHLARFLQMAADYGKEIGFNGTLLIEPKPKEPTTHQYDFDAASVLNFLQHYGLSSYKLNIECNHATLAGHTFEHELQVATNAGKLGSIDANTGDPLIGWDTDQFNTDLSTAVKTMIIVLKQGGIAPGGFNFDAKLRRESVEIADMFAAHIGSIDVFAKGLLVAEKIINDGVLDKWRNDRYSSYNQGIGKQIEQSTTNFYELEKWLKNNGEPEAKSGKQEQFENLFVSYL